MKLSELSLKLGLANVTKEITDCEVTGCYIGDLLSWVMGRAQPGNIWITVQTNVNILAVATLTEVSAIVVPENITVDLPTVSKAETQGLNILKSDKTSYELAKAIGELI